MKAKVTFNKIICQNKTAFIFMKNPIVNENIAVKMFLDK
jgi:hypothetical protein